VGVVEKLSFWFDTERSGEYINTRWWSGPISFCASKVLSFFLFLIRISFRRVQVCPGRWHIDIPLPLSNQYYKVVLKTCNEVMFFISVIPSEYVGLNSRWVGFVTTTLQLTPSSLVLDNALWQTLSPCCRRTTVFRDWRNVDCLPRVDWRFADGDGYRSKEPINVSNVPFPIFSAQRFPVWKRRTPLLYMFRLCGSPVSWVR
jgi:hypothetical protein